MRKIISVAIILGSFLILAGCNNTIDNGKKNIVTTIFPIYDIVRAISNDTVNIDLMISPGQDIHSYDPSTDDIINVKKSDLFIYIGDNMETWVQDLTKNESDMFILEIAHDTFIYAVKSVTIVEIMGRDAGWITAASALARN